MGTETTPAPRTRRRSRRVPPYGGYVELLLDCMTEPGEWFVLCEFKTRTYGYEVAKKLRAGVWQLPEGTELGDWSFEAKSSYVDGTSEVYAKYSPRRSRG